MVSIPLQEARSNRNSETVIITRKINIKQLKEFVFTEIHRDSPLYAVFLAESADEIDAAEFIIKARLWLRLAKGKLIR
ncbi:MAG: hypothetical protein OEY22_02745 [Candidatus Bathyarchaeota archaeon]|nr:hypothetical protein [Candidatus Bathyarchaeota archaeon]MDH5786704.1 hypothetical protein [Candidatus Bathyarchaeota archaeon]